MRNARSVLDSIPGFGDAEVIRQLSDGPTNDSYEVLQNGARYVLRIDRPEAERLGLDRQAELEVCHALATTGLAPTPVHFEPDTGIYLRLYLPGRAWTPKDIERKDKLEQLAELLRHVHSLPLAGREFKPLKAAGRYARQLGTAEAGNLFLQAATAYALIEPASPALCHNDLVCENILDGEKIALIDWEYAGIGDPFFDLAIVVQHHGLGAELAGHFLSAYLQRQANATDLERLQKQCRFYQALLDLWNLRVGFL